MFPNKDIFIYIERIKKTAIIDETIRIMGPLDKWTRFGIEVTFFKALLTDCLQNY